MRLQHPDDMSAIHSAFAIRTRYAEIRRKLWGKPPAQKRALAAEAAVVEALAPAAPPVEPEQAIVDASVAPPPEPEHHPWERATKISSAIAARHGVSLRDLLRSKRRFKYLVQARWEIMWTLRRELPDWSLPRIGKFMGGLDHTSVLHGIRQYERRLADRDADPSCRPRRQA
jgi:hypothetical protein